MLLLLANAQCILVRWKRGSSQRRALWSAENEALPQSKALWSAESEAKRPWQNLKFLYLSFIFRLWTAAMLATLAPQQLSFATVPTVSTVPTISDTSRNSNTLTLVLLFFFLPWENCYDLRVVCYFPPISFLLVFHYSCAIGITNYAKIKSSLSLSLSDHSINAPVLTGNVTW